MKKTNRLEKTGKNITTNVVIYIIQSILAFIIRLVFIKKIGAELLGLNNVLINTVTMLAMLECGFSTVISYKLYKPLAQNNIKKINAYMSFYKKIYYKIGFIVLIVGIIISFFLKKFIGDYSYKYLYLIYFLYLFNSVSLYFLSYKEVLLIADQKNYKLFKFNCLFTILIYVLQFVMLLIFPTNILYLLILVICKLINRIVNNFYVTKYYKEIDFNSNNKLNKNEINDIKSNIKGIFCFKVGEYVVNCTTSIIISYLINMIYVFIYSSYMTVLNMISTIIKKIYASITASFGNLSVGKDKDSELRVFEIMYFLCFLICGYITICLLNVFNIFIELWIGKEYVLSTISVLIICFNFYLITNQFPLDTIKEAKSFYKKDKFIPIILAVLNVILSLVLGKVLGFNGIMISTAISYLLTIFWNKPFIIYKYVFNVSSLKYFKDQIKFILSLIIIYFTTYFLLHYINLNVSIISFVISGLISSLVYIIMIYIFYSKRKEFKYIWLVFKNVILKILKKRY